MKTPRDEEAESAALGSVLLQPSLWPQVSAIAREADFTSERHRKIHRTITSLAQAGKPIEVLSVAFAAGLDPLFVNAMQEAVTVPGLHYAQLVAQLAARRRLIAQAQALIERANAGEDPEAIVAEALGAMHDAGWTGSGELISPEGLADAAMAEIDREATSSSALTTGFGRLDERLGGGLRSGRLYLVAARTGVGKSAFASNICRLALDESDDVLFVSLEMTGREVLTRLVADAASVDPADIPKLIREMGSDRVQSWPLHFLGRADLAGILAVTRRIVPRLLIVDYLQLVPTGQRFERRDLEVAHVTRSLKQLAVAVGIPVLACAQLSRIPEKDSRGPRLTDLRESGSQEQDADAVILLDRKVDDDAREAKLTLAKNRHGSTGSLNLYFDAVHTRFRPLAVAS